MTRKTGFAPGEYFHIYNRGTNKMKIFNSEVDYQRLVELLFLANSSTTHQYSDLEKNKLWDIDRKETLVDIGIWTLMPNHFHLVIRSKDNKSTSTFLQRILTSHSKYFNKKYDRTGSLFQGKSKSKHLGGDNHLKYMFAYCHLNPVKLIDSNWKESGLDNLENTLEFLKKYKFSSFLDYLGIDRREGKILNKNVFPEYFKNPEEHLNEIVEWLEYDKE
jgi:putative transposase